VDTISIGQVPMDAEWHLAQVIEELRVGSD
jgi:hypothetical protein